MQADDVAMLAAAPERPERARGFLRFALFLLAFLLFVILFGAWVRITGSGAGCGDHWPTCHGELVPRSPSEKTVIEYTHRLTSGLLGLCALVLPLWALRVFPRGHRARGLACVTFALVLVEAAIGAGLVLNQLVALDASVARAAAVAVHLTNTLLLTASAALTAAFAARAPTPAPSPRATAARRSAAPTLPPRARAAPGSAAPPASAPRPGDAAALVLLLAGLVLVAATGAVTALGDTLFPVLGPAGHVPPPPEHFLVQLRVLHPVLACFSVIASILVAVRFHAVPGCRRWALALGVLAGLQPLIGAANIALGAPGWLQLVHLLGAQLTWLSAVLLTAERLAPPERIARTEHALG